MTQINKEVKRKEAMKELRRMLYTLGYPVVNATDEEVLNMFQENRQDYKKAKERKHGNY